MSFDKRFYGIYSAIVADGNDPEGLGRVKLIIPQVLGPNITEWCYGIGGSSLGTVDIPYGTFTTSANQTVSAANTATVVNSSWVAQDVNKTYLSGSRIYVEETGDYFFMFSAVFTKSNASSTSADLWIRKNGVDVPDSNTRILVAGNNGETVMVANFILDLNAGDYIELVFSSPDANTKLTYYSASSSPTRPAVPGVIATLNLIGKWTPKPGTRAWAMFEAGDPNFPVWMGAL